MNELTHAVAALLLPPTGAFPLLLLAWWWGGLRRRQETIEGSFSLGLLALLGTALLNLTLLLQWLLIGWRAGGAVPAVAEGMASGSPLLTLAGPPAAILALPVVTRGSSARSVRPPSAQSAE